MATSLPIILLELVSDRSDYVESQNSTVESARLALNSSPSSRSREWRLFKKKPPPEGASKEGRRPSSTVDDEWQRSSRFAEGGLHARLQRLNRVSRHFLRHPRELRGLLGERLKLLARVRD
jgi:hypothetical protein